MQNKTKALPNKPTLSRSYHIIPMDNDRVQFRNGQDLFVIRGAGLLELTHDLFPLLDGQLTTDEIINCLDGQHSQENIIGLLRRLTQRRVVKEFVEGEYEVPGMSEMQKIYFSQFSGHPQPNLTALSKARVTVLGLGPLGAALAKVLARSGVGTITVSDNHAVGQDDILLSGYLDKALGNPRVETFMSRINEEFPNTKWESQKDPFDENPERGAPDYIVVCLENYRPDTLKLANDFSLSHGIPYTWCCLDCTHGTIGPTVLPHETACFNCYTTRARANADYPEELQAYESQLSQNGNQTAFGYLPPHIQILAGIASLEIIKDLSGLTPPLTYNAQLEINLLTMEFALHPVLKLPRCPSCGRLLSSGAAVRPFAERQL